MKKILFAAVAALAIVGCTQNEEFDKAGEKAEIKLDAIVGSTTRATITESSNFTTFKVYGYKTEAKIAADATLNAFMPGVEVNKADNKWGYTTGPYYWPLTGFVQFFAVSPALNLTTTTGYPNFEYTVGAIADQEDLLAANLIDKEKTTEALKLPFGHLLTQVNFSIKGEKGFTYTLTKLELTGVKDKGTFTFDGTTTVGAWSAQALTSPTPTEYAYAGSLELVSDGTNSANVENDGNALFMLLPQKIGADAVKVKVTYSAKTTKDGQVTVDNDTKEISLPSVTWEKGKRIRYTLNLTSDATQVTFDEPVWSEWTDQTQPVDPITPVTPPAPQP